MTGFSKSERSRNGITVSVEIKSLNSRNLDLNVKLPRLLSHRELNVRDLVRKELDRGSVSVYINVDYDADSRPFVFNDAAAEQYLVSLLELRKRLKIKETVKFEHLLQFSSYFMHKEEDEDEEAVWNLVYASLTDALKNLTKMRAREGANISKDIFDRIKKIQELVDQIEVLGIERIPDERERMRQRIAQLFENDEIDEYRLQMEMVIMADKLDISEECVRLGSHLKVFRELEQEKEPVGRKMNFILQEMNREINTIGSKANDAIISQLVVEVKEELERIREQSQNIE